MGEVEQAGRTLPGPRMPDQTQVRHPVVLYLTQLDSGTSKKTMLDRLHRLAKLAQPDADAFTYPWHQLQAEHVGLLRDLIERQTTDRRGGEPQPWSVAYRNNHLAALRGVLDALHSLRLMTGDELKLALKNAKNFRGTRLPRGRIVGMGEFERLAKVCLPDGIPSPAEVSAAAEAGKADLSGLRDLAAITFLYYGGPRRAEVPSVKVKDYDPETGEVRIIGKGDKERKTFLHPAAASLVSLWLVAYEADSRRDTEGSKAKPRAAWSTELALFPPIHKSGSVQRRHMSPDAVRNLLNSRRVQAGLMPLTPHDFRYTFISNMLPVADVSLVADLVGHSSVTTTQRYDRRGEEAAREAVRGLQTPAGLEALADG